MKFLVIGPGLIGRKHIQLIQDNKECNVEAIVALHPERHQCYESDIGAKVYSSLDDAFQNHTFDGVIISSPNELHYEQAVYCIDKGIPVLVEKPLTQDLDSAEKLVSYAEARSVPVLVGHHRTYSSFMPEAKDILSSERFGRLVSVQGSAQFYKPNHYFTEGEWRTKKGGGPILINLIHEVGIMRSLCGEIKSVFAFASNKTRNFEVEDTVSISLEFENGCLGSFVLSDCAASNKSWEMTSGENPSYPHYPKESCYHFTGTNGSLDFPSMKSTFYRDPDDASWWKDFEHDESKIEIEDPLACQLAHFLDVIKGNSEALVSARSGYNNMRVVDAIQQSITQRALVEL
ncbi:Gfo/Idh/MocA family protein [Vibrio sp. THAF190c]|uniref:Gfo/Idh/MocA family protein n=1 Tax=Vibrio sp. THAF190c TaxID=2587865 RepID=UPI00126930AB|nr:Gfo/Idh/MocA family oxidoreductase [Vibrio sp. THAF190c]QFT08549.1 1,5-anhydro-D-fructose reductase [Vibrio sp. THAF190c]|tara:strand:- start:6166 stop:7203 length:1038 start_codon:yes stop_codon:yes gene_type:complete